jgi:heat shock protein HslJ
MKIHKILFVLTLVLTLALTACGASAKAPELNGTAWNLLAINGQPVVENSNSTLVFEAESAGGNGSCNSFGGEYQSKGGNLTFGPMMSTMMYCEEVMDQESAYLAALAESATYEVRDGNLIIFNEKGQEILTFVPQG